MTKIATRSNKLSGVLAFEEQAEYGVCRENVTVTMETGMDVGAVLRRTITSGTGTYTADSGNTGNFTCGTVTITDPAKVGNYRIVFTAATAFNLYTPEGVLLTSGATGTAVNGEAGQGLSFTLTAGGTAAVAGDSGTIAVAGTNKYKWIAAADVAALTNDVAVLIESVKDVPSLTNATDYAMTVLSSGWAGVVGDSLLYKDALSAPQKADVLRKLKAKFIVNRTRV
jgi:hypothetical protein